MKQVMKNEFRIVAIVAATLLALSVVGTLASRRAPAVTFIKAVPSPVVPKPAPAPTDRTVQP